MTHVNNFVENGGRLCRTLVRSVSVDVDPNVQKNFTKFPVFFGMLPRVLPARENRISTQGAVRTQPRSVKCLCGAFLVWLAAKLMGAGMLRTRHRSNRPGAQVC